MSCCRLSLFGLALALLVGAQAAAQPGLQSASPQAAAPGKTTEVLLRGQKLDEPLRVWTSFPAQVQVVQENVEKKDRGEVKLQITVDAATPPQIGGLIVGNSIGISDPLFFLVDDLPSVADNGQNQALDKAQVVAVPCGIDGVVDGTRGDVYKFDVAAGQRLSVEVLAQRLNADLDPIVRLLDAQGRPLVVADDDTSTGADGRFSYTFVAAGSYFLEVRDVRYRGGPNYRYRLRLGDFPIVTTPFPLGVTAGQSAQVSVLGNNVEGIAPVAFTADAASPLARQPLAVRGGGGTSSALLSIVSSSLPQTSEVEPNDTPEAATKVTLPAGIQGRFHADKDRDQYTFDAKANTSFTFRAVTRSAGSPCYLLLSVFKPDGGLLAESPVNENDEPTLAVTFPADGAYRLVVEDLLRRGGPERGYYVEAALNPGFSLSLKPDKNTPHRFALPKNGAIAIEVQAARGGYDGPITLAVEPASAGFTLVNNVIGEKQPATRLIISTPAKANVGDLLPLRIVGTAMHQGQAVRVPLNTTALLRAKWPQLSAPPAWFDGMLATAVTAEAPQLYTVSPSQPALFYPRTAAQLVFTLNLERKRPDFKEPLTVQVENLPAGVSAEVKREGDGPQEKYHITLKAPKELGEIKQDLRLVTYGNLNGQGELATTVVPLAVVTPIVTTLTPTGPITAGQKQTVKVAIARFNPGSGEDKQPVTIKWKKLPAGVTAPETVIAPDQTEAMVEFTAVAEAEVGPFEGLLAEAVTKFQGLDVAIDSTAAKWEVVK